MSGISVLKQKMREKMGTARGLSSIPEVSASIQVDVEFVKFITRIDKATQGYVKSIRGGATTLNELSVTNLEYGTSAKMSLESYRKISSILQTLSEYEKELMRMWNELAARIESEITSNFRAISNEALFDAKQQISVFEKSRLQADAAASEASAVAKKEKNEQKVEQAKANADAKMKEFLTIGDETQDILNQLHMSVEADTIDLLCDYLEMLSISFNNALRASNELVPVLFQTKSYIEELREKHIGSNHARQSGEADQVKRERLFGRALEDVLAAEKSQVPHIVSTLIQFIESHHLGVEGIYWRGIPATDLVVIKRGFDQLGVIPDASVLSSPESAAALLKSFFRELPEPLLTRQLFDSFIETNNLRDSRDKAEKLAAIVQQLPIANKIIASRLFGHLHNIASNAATNLMSAGRLATAWATILLVPPQGSSPVSDDPFEVRAVVEALIESAPLVFS